MVSNNLIVISRQTAGLLSSKTLKLCMWTSLRISSAQEKEISNLAHAETPSKIGVCPKRHFQRSYDAYFNENDLKNLRRLIIPCWSHCIKWAKSPYTWFARMFYIRDSLPLARDVVRFSTFKIPPHRSAGYVKECNHLAGVAWLFL